MSARLVGSGFLEVPKQKIGKILAMKKIKRVFNVILAGLLLLSSVTIGSAQTDLYNTEVQATYVLEAVAEVTTLSYPLPYLLAEVGTPIDLTRVALETNMGRFPGSVAMWSGGEGVLSGQTPLTINNADNTITVLVPGVYRVTATVNDVSLELYVVVRGTGESDWVLYENDFTGIADGDMPEGWVRVGNDGLPFTSANTGVQDGQMVMDYGNANTWATVRLPDFIDSFGDYSFTAGVAVQRVSVADRFFGMSVRAQETHTGGWFPAVPESYFIFFRANAASAPMNAFASGFALSATSATASEGVLSPAFFTHNRFRTNLLPADGPGDIHHFTLSAYGNTMSGYETVDGTANQFFTTSGANVSSRGALGQWENGGAAIWLNGQTLHIDYVRVVLNPVFADEYGTVDPETQAVTTASRENNWILAVAGESIDLSDIVFSTNIGPVSGDRARWSNGAGVSLQAVGQNLAIDSANNTITAPARGVYNVTARVGRIPVELFVVARADGDTEYVLYEQDFSAVPDGGLPTGWMGRGGPYNAQMVAFDTNTVRVQSGELVIDSNRAGFATVVYLPAFLSAFGGNYRFTADVRMADAVNSNRWFALSARGQERNLAPGAAGAPRGYQLTIRRNAASQNIAATSGGFELLARQPSGNNIFINPFFRTGHLSHDLIPTQFETFSLDMHGTAIRAFHDEIFLGSTENPFPGSEPFVDLYQEGFLSFVVDQALVHVNSVQVVLNPDSLEELPPEEPPILGTIDVDVINPNRENNPAGLDQNGVPFPGFRGTNQVVVYTEAFSQPTTGTNMWGMEISVNAYGIITRITTGGQEANHTIPHGGFVISAHISTAGPIAQMADIAVIGGIVTLCEDTMTLTFTMRAPVAPAPWAQVEAPTTSVSVPAAIVTEPADLETMMKASALPGTAVIGVRLDDGILVGYSREDGIVFGGLQSIMYTLDERVIPAFYVTDAASADALAVFLMENVITDVSIISNDHTLVRRVREQSTHSRGIVDFRGTTQTERWNFVRDTNIALGRVALLDGTTATPELIRYIQRLGVMVWVEDNVADENRTVNLHTFLQQGMDGVVSADYTDIVTAFAVYTGQNTLLRQPLIVGHRGAPHVRPENTLAGFRIAFENGAEMIEVDVMPTVDNYLVVTHDQMILPLTNHFDPAVHTTVALRNQMNVKTMTLAQLRDGNTFMAASHLNAQLIPNYVFPEEYWAQIPILEDVLELAMEFDRVVIIEFKCQDWYSPRLTAAVIERMGAHEHVIIAAFAHTDWGQNLLRRFQSYAPGITTIGYAMGGDGGYFLRSDAPELSLASLKPIFQPDNNIISVNSHAAPGAINHINNHFMRAAQNRGIPILPWTFGSNATFFGNYYQNGLFGLITGAAHMLTNAATQLHADSDSVQVFVNETATLGATIDTRAVTNFADVSEYVEIIVLTGGDIINVSGNTITATETGTAQVMLRYNVTGVIDPSGNALGGTSTWNYHLYSNPVVISVTEPSIGEPQPVPEPVIFSGNNPNVLRALLEDNDVILKTAGNLGIFTHHSPFTIPAGRTLTVATTLNVQANAQLVIEGTLIVQEGGRVNNQGAGGGTIRIANGGRIVNNGHVENVTNSTVINYGTIENNARFEVRANTTFCSCDGAVIGSVSINTHRNAITCENG